MSNEKKKCLYHCDGCGRDIVEDDLDYGDCPACGEGNQKYKFVKEVTEVPEGAILADSLGSEEEDEEDDDLLEDLEKEEAEEKADTLSP